MRRSTLVATAVLAVALAGCAGTTGTDTPTASGEPGAVTTVPAATPEDTGGGGGRSAEIACDDFARYVRDGQPREDRAEVIRDVAALSRASGVAGLINGAETLERVGPDGTDGAWKLAADTFAQSCFDNEWNG